MLSSETVAVAAVVAAEAQDEWAVRAAVEALEGAASEAERGVMGGAMAVAMALGAVASLVRRNRSSHRRPRRGAYLCDESGGMNERAAIHGKVHEQSMSNQ